MELWNTSYWTQAVPPKDAQGEYLGPAVCMLDMYVFQSGCEWEAMLP